VTGAGPIVNLDRLSLRLFASFAGLILVIVAAVALWGEIRVRRFYAHEVERRLEVAAALLIERSESALAHAGPDPAFDAHLGQLGRLTRLRLTVIRDDGVVLADSESPLPIANHADRPEVRLALGGQPGTDQRRSSTTGQRTHYLALPVRSAGRVIGCVRASAPLDDMEGALAELRTSLVLVGALALGAGLLLAGLLARRLASPLENMAREAEALGEGDLARRVAPRGPVETRALARALNTMAARLQQRVESERTARGELEAILGGMAEGVVALDAAEQVLLMNAAAARLLGLEEPLAAGSPLWRVLRFPELERELRAVLARPEAGPGTPDVRSFDATPQGNGRTLAISIAPLSIEGLETRRGAVVLLSDVTTTRRLDQMRSDFVANVSHELRTPLTAIMGALEILAEPSTDEATEARFVEIAARNAARLKAIVNDLLDLSSLEAQSESLARAPLSTSAALRNAAAALAGAAQKKGVQLEVEAPRSSRADVLGDESRLEQCFTNLLANAIQYTPAGGRVTARARSLEDEVEVVVEDTGIGIPATALPRVFERFYRVDRGRGRDTGGTGLGLALVKHIALAHGGRVDVASEEGHGSVFTVRLPRRSEA